MLKIAIVDDNLTFCQEFEHYLKKYVDKIFNNYIIETISTDFEKILKQSYDLVFLDIDLIFVDGIKLAKAFISNSSKNTLLIFVTTRNDLVFESLSVQPFYFVRKSNIRNDLTMCFILLKKYYRDNSALYTFQYNGRKTCIKKSDILYIESNYHNICITTKEDLYIYRSTLKAILEELNSKRFSRIQKSIIINFDYVKEIDNNDIILTTGNIFSINRNYKKQVIFEYQEYLLIC